MKDLFFNYTPINALNYEELLQLFSNEDVGRNISDRNNLRNCIFYFSDTLYSSQISQIICNGDVYFIGTIIVSGMPVPCYMCYDNTAEDPYITLRKISDNTEITLSDLKHYPIYGTISFGQDYTDEE